MSRIMCKSRQHSTGKCETEALELAGYSEIKQDGILTFKDSRTWLGIGTVNGVNHAALLMEIGQTALVTDIDTAGLRALIEACERTIARLEGAPNEQ